jgi:hypothetical protein
LTPLEVPELRISGDGSTEVEADNSYQRFVRKGIVNYVDAIWKIYIALKPSDTLVFNVTGGYRGMLPIARDLTLLLSAHSHDQGERLPITIKMCILFKSGNELVHYDALPVSFRWRLRLAEDLQLAGGDLGVDSRQLHLSDHPEWRAFFEGVPGQSNLMRRSPLGEVVLALAKRLDRGELVDE